MNRASHQLIEPLILTSLILLYSIISVGQVCGTTNLSTYEDILPDLYPPRTIKIGVHLIHKTSLTDGTNISNDSIGNAFFELLEDSINHVLGNLGDPNYFQHGRYFGNNDAKFRVQFYKIYHHVHWSLWSGQYNGSVANISDFRSHLVTNNSSLTSAEKNDAIPIFLFGGDTLGGAATLNSKNGVRLKGQIGNFNFWKDHELLQYKYVGNIIHELMHSLNIYHNQYLDDTGAIAPYSTVYYKAACDYVLNPNQRWQWGHPSHKDIIDTFINNNFIHKYEGTSNNWKPGYNSMSYCQIQRMLWSIWNYDNHPHNHIRNIEQSLTFFQPCNNTFNAEIKSDQILNYDFKAFGNIIIKSGASLTVTCELQMPQDAKIIVEPGGKLIVDGGTILNSCGSFWGGIEVRSNSIHSQLDAFLDINYNNLGFVHIKNNSIIKNATIGVYRKTQVAGTNSYKGGGIVKIENSDFINNNISVYMDSYQGAYPGTYRKLKDLSFISNTNFITSSSYPSSAQPPLHQIFLNGTNGVDVTNCEFINNTTLTNGRQVGITAVNASVTIYDNEFNDLKEAVRLVNTYKRPAIRVEQNDFNDCQTGTFSQNADNSLIVNNDFTNCGIGSILQASVGFKHTENTYTTTNSALQSIGIGSRDLSNASNRIYKNNFEDLDIGVFSSGKTFYSNQGLQYKCNEFEPNSIDVYDILVNSGEIDIAQGDCDQSATVPAAVPSGNALSHTCGNLNDDIQVIDLQPSKIIYAHHFESTAGPFTPQCYDAVDVFAKGCGAQYSTTLSCPSENVFTGTPAVFASSKQTVVTNFYNYKDDFNSTTATFMATLDGGNTTVLKSQIDSVIGAGDSVNVFVQGVSSSISDEVLNYCVNHTVGLTGEDLYKLLEAYSPLSPPLAETVSTLTNQLTPAQITELQGMQTGLSPRDLLEHEIRYNEQQAELALSELMSLFLYDTTLDTLNQAEDSMLLYLVQWNTNWSKEQQVKLLWQLEEYTTAQQVINDLDTQPNYQNTVTLLQLMHNAFANDTDITYLISDTVLIDSIALDTTQMGYALAQGLMMELTGKVYATTFKYDDMVWSRSASEATITETKLGVSPIKIYPNPNHGKFIIEGLPNVFHEQELVTISVYNALGKMVYENRNQSATLLEIDLPNGLDGLYFLKIEDNNGKVITETLLINEQ